MKITLFSKYHILKAALFIALLAYSITVSILLIMNRPETHLIGIDENGVRLIREDKDQLIAKEKVNFLKNYMASAYIYNSNDYREKITQAGNLMNDKLWNQKREEYEKRSNDLKTQFLTQESLIQEIRAVDDYTFESDVLITVKNKLKVAQIKLRVEIVIQSHSRNNINPYAWEVVSYAENERT